jgi:hypothetical protein
VSNKNQTQPKQAGRTDVHPARETVTSRKKACGHAELGEDGTSDANSLDGKSIGKEQELIK